MQPADLAITLRRRSPWEAMDLGLAMLQRWWRQAYAARLLVALPLVAAALGVAWWLEKPWVALVLVWWLKPLYDRVVLHVLSRAVFGELQGPGRVLGAPKEWLATGLVPALLGRFLWPDLARSFNLPVRQLEGQAGGAGRARRAVLARRIASYASWLTLTCVLFEILLYKSAGQAAHFLLPAKAAEGRSLFEVMYTGADFGGFFTYTDALAYAAAVLLLEPFYVAAGFGLYLNRRTLLEGWDIEVALRRIAEKHAAALLVLVFSVFSLAASIPASAQAKDPKKEIAEVLKAKEFGYEREVERWRWREREPSKDESAKPGEPAEWLVWLVRGMAKLAELLLWIAAGGLIAFALWWAARMLPALRGPPATAPYRPPAALFGMQLAPETLPADVGAAAAALARDGKLREALGLLYRGSLSELVHKRGVQLLASHTEGDVLRLSGKQAFLGELIDAWRACAYAMRMPGVADVERLAHGYRAAFP